MSIRGHDATAWVEVHTSIGWVAIDVVPSNTGIPEEQETSSQPDQQPLPPVPPALPEGGQPNTDDAGMHTNPVQPPVDPADRMPPGAAPGCWSSSGSPAARAWSLATIVVDQAAQVRGTGDPSAIPSNGRSAAWRDFVDLAIDRGRDLEGDRTRQEYAGEDSQVLAFAKATDAAVFSRSQTDEETVDDLWRSARRAAGRDRPLEIGLRPAAVARLTLLSLDSRSCSACPPLTPNRPLSTDAESLTVALQE